MFASLTAHMRDALEVRRTETYDQEVDGALMGALDEMITERYAIYNGHCIEIMAGLPAGIGASIGVLPAVRAPGRCELGTVPLLIERAGPVEQ